MAPVLLLAALAATATAQSCCFNLTASNGAPVGQLADGQNRINQTNLPTPESLYCLDDSTGGLTDEQGRGCLLAYETEQFQCDQGSAPTAGFSLASNGTLEYNGSAVFWSCPTSDNNGWNLYAQPLAGQTQCTPIELNADNTCQRTITTITLAADCSTSSTFATAAPSAPTAAAPTATASSSSSSGCPLDLTGDWQYPHLIVHVDQTHPDTAYGTSYNGTALSGSVASLYTFDIPTSYNGKTCSVIFAWPMQSQLTTSSYATSGNGLFDLAVLSRNPNEGTTYNSVPAAQEDIGDVTLAPGTAVTVATSKCAAGDAVSFEMRSAGGNIDYFQDYNPCAIGLYMVAK